MNNAIRAEHPLIVVDQLYRLYNEGYENEVRALDGVSFSVERGEYLAIIGASGSGKSTLMNILGCLDLPTYGSYYLDGQLIETLSGRQLAKIRNHQIGFIFQGFNLLPGLTALENVELPLVYQGMREGKRWEHAEEALTRVGLEDRMDHKPAEMSGGQQQRVAIARALATHPSIILADEPTGNLDSRTGRHVIEILSQLNAEGVTILLITHDDQVAQMARRRIRIQDGRIVEEITAPPVSAPAGQKGR